MNACVRLLGLASESATESEVHQRLLEATDLNSIVATQVAKATEGVQAQVVLLQQQVEALNSQIASLQSDLTNRDIRLAELSSELGLAQVGLSNRESENKELQTQNTFLAGEVAKLRAGRIPANQVDATDGIEIKPNNPSGGSIVNEKELIRLLNIK